MNSLSLGKYGFQFLLVFVFATIPAGIYAKLVYHDILANVDVLHGVAESFLTITNLLIIQGFRSARSDAVSSPQLISLPSLSSSSLSSSSSVTEAVEEEGILSKTTSINDSVDDNNIDNTLVVNSNNDMNSQQDVVNKNLVDDIMNVFQRYKFSVFLLFPTVIVLLNYWKDSGIISTLFASSSSLSSSSLPFLSTIIHKEPLNALSLPTWIIHTSSLLEWLAAMQLIWDHAKVSNNPRWKGLTWAMIPSHTSGICACTYHLFYNSPVLLSLVSFQATFTVLGNIFLAIAAYRIYKYEYKQLQQISTDQQLSGHQQQQDTQQDIITPQTTTAASYLNPINITNNYPIVITTTTTTSNDVSSSSSSFWLNLFIKSTLFAIIIKYGELYSNIPFEPSLLVALSIISALTMTNVLKWISASSSSSSMQSDNNINDNLLYPM